jgi:hypothetical protein
VDISIEVLQLVEFFPEFFLVVPIGLVKSLQSEVLLVQS